MEDVAAILLLPIGVLIVFLALGLFLVAAMVYGVIAGVREIRDIS